MTEEYVDVEELTQEDSEKIKEKVVFCDENHSQFYEKIRNKLKNKLQSNSKVSNRLIDYLFLLPDFFILLVRLSADDRIDTKLKVFIGAVIVYVISPIDFIPDFIPVFGYADDLTLVVLALNQLLNKIDTNILEENWSGESDLLESLQHLAHLGEQFLDKNVLSKVKKWIRNHI